MFGERVPFYDTIAKIVNLADNKKISLVASPLSFTTVDYVLSKFESQECGLNKLRKFKVICEICEVNEQTIEKGLISNFKDFENLIQYFSAVESNCSIIITRNGKDFKNYDISVMSAEEYLSSII